MESVYVMARREIWRRIVKFWGALFGINLAMGVATRLLYPVMLLAAVILMPIMLAYTSRVYYVLRGKVSEDSVAGEDSSY